MNIESFREYCLAKPEVSESFPFDNNTLVFKVCNKMFALTGLKPEDFRINLKCEPEKAIQLREEYDGVIPGYHMSKKHWNTIIVDASISDEIILEWIDHSYDEVVKTLPKKVRETLI
tara:strand:- start:253 stop:603 length:351 start_codon:yes stop_codon:yes gene_type:complete